jgi:hypothetical protein
MLAWSARKLARSAAATAGPACAETRRRRTGIGIARSAGTRDIGPDDIPPCAHLGHSHGSPPVAGSCKSMQRTCLPRAAPLIFCRSTMSPGWQRLLYFVNRVMGNMPMMPRRPLRRSSATSPIATWSCVPWGRRLRFQTAFRLPQEAGEANRGDQAQLLLAAQLDAGSPGPAPTGNSLEVEGTSSVAMTVSPTEFGLFAMYPPTGN